jgi:hypothetical protein
VRVPPFYCANSGNGATPHVGMVITSRASALCASSCTDQPGLHSRFIAAGMNLAPLGYGHRRSFELQRAGRRDRSLATKGLFTAPCSWSGLGDLVPRRGGPVDAAGLTQSSRAVDPTRQR